MSRGVSRSVLRTEQVEGQQVSRIDLHGHTGWERSLGLCWGLDLLRNFPGEDQTALLSLWGGSEAGHTSHRKPTSKEPVREERWLVPTRDWRSGRPLVPNAAYVFLHGS